MLQVIASIYVAVWYLIIAALTFVIVLMAVRIIMNAVDVNPFTRPAMAVRRLSDIFINPVRKHMAGLGVPTKYAPLIVLLLVILLGWFASSLAGSVLSTLAGLLLAAQSRAFIAALGYLLYGLLGLYSLLIFIRIIFSWGQVSYANRLMRFLVDVTDPLLVPLRRMLPPVGMFDLSPLVAFIIIWLFQAAIAGTLLRGQPPLPIG
ncbi:MAG: YggT family protein [Acidobacteria bacterium]|nr:YggT family protein [Acidobacteriota bacterium]